MFGRCSIHENDDSEKTVAIEKKLKNGCFDKNSKMDKREIIMDSLKQTNEFINGMANW